MRFLAKEFAPRLGFDRVLLMPTFVPPHKLKSDMAPAQDLSLIHISGGQKRHSGGGGIFPFRGY